jgi:hypothetical protein
MAARRSQPFGPALDHGPVPLFGDGRRLFADFPNLLPRDCPHVHLCLGFHLSRHCFGWRFFSQKMRATVPGGNASWFWPGLSRAEFNRIDDSKRAG